MKLSEAIAQLQELQERVGDVELWNCKAGTFTTPLSISEDVYQDDDNNSVVCVLIS